MTSSGPPPPPYGVAQQPYGYRPPAPHHASAVPSLVLGIVGLVSVVACLGIGLVVSPFAWALGSRAVQEIDAAPPGTYRGRDQAGAGRIMGIIGTVLLVLGVLGVAALIVGLAVADGND